MRNRVIDVELEHRVAAFTTPMVLFHDDELS